MADVYKDVLRCAGDLRIILLSPNPKVVHMSELDLNVADDSSQSGDDPSTRSEGYVSIR